MAVRRTESSYLQAARERVVVFDGAMGTNLQLPELTADDFGGPDLEGCNELLVRHPARRRRPGPPVVLRGRLRRGRDRHLRRLRPGAGRVRPGPTGSASSTWPPPRSPGRPPTTTRPPDQPRWVAGSIGPGTKFPTLGQIRYADLRDAYEEQAAGPHRGRRRPDHHRDGLRPPPGQGGHQRRPPGHGGGPASRLPIQVQVTIELTGTHAPGHRGRRRPRRPRGHGRRRDRPQLRHRPGRDVRAAPPPDRPRADARVVPAQRRPARRWSTGKMHYDLDARPARRVPPPVRHRARRVSVIGGCCGTTPDHLRAVVEACADLTPGRTPARARAGRGLDLHPRPLRPGHARSWWWASAPTPTARRSSARPCSRPTGTPAWPWPRSRSRRARHVIDVCVDYTGADGVADMERGRLAASPPSPPLPLMVDSTEAPVVETALSWIGGRAVINSVNLEEGDGAGHPPRLRS